MCALHSAHDGQGHSGPRRRSLHMDFGLFTKIVDEISTFRPFPSVGLNYAGESLLHPRFLDALALLKDRGLGSRTGFNTNATVLRPEIAEAIIDSDVRSVSISLDGFQGSHERIRMGSRYDKVVENTMSLLEARRRRGATNPSIIINLTRVGQEESEIQAFVDHWAMLADEVRVYEQIAAHSSLVTRNEAIDRVLSTRKPFCSDPWKYIAVLADGRITLCCHDILGLGGGFDANVAENAILRVWRSPGYRRVRHSILAGQFGEIPACRRCEAWAGEYVHEDLPTGEYIARRTGLGVSYRRREQVPVQ